MENTINSQQIELIQLLEHEVKHQQWLIEAAQRDMIMYAERMLTHAKNVVETTTSLANGDAFFPKGGEHMQTAAGHYADAEARMMTATQAKRSTERILEKALAAKQ